MQIKVSGTSIISIYSTRFFLFCDNNDATQDFLLKKASQYVAISALLSCDAHGDCNHGNPHPSKKAASDCRRKTTMSVYPPNVSHTFIGSSIVKCKRVRLLLLCVLFRICKFNNFSLPTSIFIILFRCSLGLYKEAVVVQHLATKIMLIF